jgi:hypothetical protein
MRARLVAARSSTSSRLPLCDGERKMIALLGPGSVPGDVQHIASHTMKLGLAPPLVSRLDDLACLGKASLASGSRPVGIGLGEGRDITGVPWTAPVARVAASPCVSEATPSSAWPSAVNDHPW